MKYTYIHILYIKHTCRWKQRAKIQNALRHVGRASLPIQYFIRWPQTSIATSNRGTPFVHAETSRDMVGSCWWKMDPGEPPGTRIHKSIMQAKATRNNEQCRPLQLCTTTTLLGGNNKRPYLVAR